MATTANKRNKSWCISSASLRNINILLFFDAQRREGFLGWFVDGFVLDLDEFEWILMDLEWILMGLEGMFCLNGFPMHFYWMLMYFDNIVVWIEFNRYLIVFSVDSNAFVMGFEIGWILNGFVIGC